MKRKRRLSLIVMNLAFVLAIVFTILDHADKPYGLLSLASLTIFSILYLYTLFLFNKELK